MILRYYIFTLYMIIIYDCDLNIPTDMVIVTEPGGEKGKISMTLLQSSFFDDDYQNYRIVIKTSIFK